MRNPTTNLFGFETLAFPDDPHQQALWECFPAHLSDEEAFNIIFEFARQTPWMTPKEAARLTKWVPD
jgi:hypothetical protein